MKTCLLIALICFACLNRSFAQRKNLIFEADFNNETSIAKWYERALLNPWSAAITSTTKKSGSGAVRFELNRDLDKGNGPRVELGMAPQTENEFWYGFSMLLPGSYVKDNTMESLVQFQSIPDFNIGEDWRSAPLFLGVLNDRFILEIRADSNKVTRQGIYSFMRVDLGQVVKDSWTDWVFHVKWAYNNTGILEIWKNNEKILSRLNLPNSYNDVKYPYFKIGIYKWEWSDLNTKSTTRNRTYFVDEVRVGNKKATYQDVAPGNMETVPISNASLLVSKHNDGSYLVSFQASKTIKSPTKLVLFVSSDNGKQFTAIYSDSTVTLEKGQSYKLTFK